MAQGREGSIRTVQDAFDRYAREVSPDHKGERWEVVRLAKLGLEFARVMLDKLTTAHIVRWRVLRLMQVGPASVLREMKLLSAVFEQGRKEWKWLIVNPAKDVRKPTAPPHRERVLSLNEIKRLLRALAYLGRTLPLHAVPHACCWLCARICDRTNWPACAGKMCQLTMCGCTTQRTAVPVMCRCQPRRAGCWRKCADTPLPLCTAPKPATLMCCSERPRPAPG